MVIEKGNVGLSLPKAFVNIIRLAVRNYYDELRRLKKV